MGLKETIKNNGIKQSWVAEKLGISGAYLSYILSGKRRLTAQLEEAFDCLLDKIKGEKR